VNVEERQQVESSGPRIVPEPSDNRLGSYGVVHEWSMAPADQRFAWVPAATGTPLAPNVSTRSWRATGAELTIRPAALDPLWHGLVHSGGKAAFSGQDSPCW
jgi:hypothetical protein